MFNLFCFYEHLQLAVALFVMARCGSSITIWTLSKLCKWNSNIQWKLFRIDPNAIRVKKQKTLFLLFGSVLWSFHHPKALFFFFLSVGKIWWVYYDVSFFFSVLTESYAFLEKFVSKVSVLVCVFTWELHFPFFHHPLWTSLIALSFSYIYIYKQFVIW